MFDNCSACDLAHSYTLLVERFGVERIATAILIKWRLDDDAGQQWEHLMARINIAQPVEQRRLTPGMVRTLRVVRDTRLHAEAAALRRISLHMVEGHLYRARRRLGVASTGEAIRAADKLGLLDLESDTDIWGDDLP